MWGWVAMEATAALAAGEAVTTPDLLVACALLHDTLEDTATTFADLEQSFGSEIARGVLALTKDKKLPGKEAQMQESLACILEQPREVWMVKLADRITNLQPPPAYWDVEKIQRYRAEAVHIMETLAEASPYLSGRLREKIDRYAIHC